MVQQHEIRWADSLPPFAGPGSELPDDGYAIEAMADGTNFGNPEALIEIVRSLLTDGSLAVLEGWDNRTVPIRLRLSAPTAIAGPALAAAESALMAAILATPKAPLIYVPPAQDAATCVFDVVAAKLDRDTSDGWDQDEVMREERYYLLTLTCLPFARTENTVVVPALGEPPTPGSPPIVVDIDTCASFAGWAVSFTNMTATSSGSTGGYIYATGTKQPNSSTAIRLTRTGAVTMGTEPILKVTATWTASATPETISASFDGGAAVYPLARFGNDLFFDAPASFNTVAFTLAYADLAITPARSLRILNVARTDSIGTPTGTTRQLSRTANVSGSAPTQAAVRLYDETPAALGADVLVFTSPSTSLQPPISSLLYSGATPSPNAARISGKSISLDNSLVFRIPAASVPPGTYAVVARVSNSSASVMPVVVSARLIEVDGSDSLASGAEVSCGATVPVTSLSVFSLGALSLPPALSEGDQLIELTLAAEVDDNQGALDELWLFDLTHGALTWVQSSEDIAWMEIRSPELGATRPSVFGGAGAVSENGVSIDHLCQSFGAHRFDPGLMQVFTVCSSSLVSQSEIEFYPRGHSHVEAGWTE